MDSTIQIIRFNTGRNVVGFEGSDIPETRWNRAGRTVPTSDPLKEETPFSTITRGCRPSKKSASVAMKPPRTKFLFLIIQGIILSLATYSTPDTSLDMTDENSCHDQHSEKWVVHKHGLQYDMGLSPDITRIVSKCPTGIMYYQT